MRPLSCIYGTIVVYASSIVNLFSQFLKITLLMQSFTFSCQLYMKETV